MFKILINILFVFTTFMYGEKLQKVSLQLKWLDQFQFAGYYIAKEKGFYQNIGLDVEIKPYSSNINIVKDVESHITTYGIGSPSLIIDKVDDKKIILLSAIFQSSPLILLTTKKSGIKTVKDFKNKKVMFTSDTKNTISIQAMINKFHVEDTLILKKHSFNIDDLISGKIDLMSSYISNEPFLLKQKGIEPIIFNPTDYGFDFYSDILFTSEIEILNHKQRAIDFKEASLKGWRYAFTHIDETIDIILKKYNTQHKSKEALLYEANELKKLAYFKTTQIGDINKHKIQRIYDLYNVVGLISKQINLDDFILNSRNATNTLTKKEVEYLKTKKELTVCVKKGWLPYESIKNDQFIGLSADFLKLYGKKLNIKLNIIKSDNQLQSLEYLKEKRCDIKPIIVSTKVGRIPYNSTTPYFYDNISLVTRLEQGYIQDLEKVDRPLLIAKDFYQFISVIKTKYPNIKLKNITNSKKALKMVADSKAFGYIGTSLTSSYIIQKEFSSKLKIINNFKNIHFGFGVVEDQPILKNILNQMIKNTTQEEKNTIYNRWITTTIEKKKDHTLFWQIGGVFLLLFIFIIYKNIITTRHNKELEIKIKKAVEKNNQQNQKILQQSRFAQMGEMISMIAHQWRQPLGAITSRTGYLHIQLMMKQEITPTQLKRELDKINEYAQHLSSTINDFRDFFKEHKNKTKMELNELTKGVLSIIEQSLLGKNIKLIVNLDSNQDVYTYTNEVKQVLLNILKNAEDILLEKEIEHPTITITTQNNYILIADNAGGIPKDIMPKIFDPYFSTKIEKDGTGLGLYMSKTIIEDHCKGKLTVENGTKGAIFKLEFREINKGEK